MINCCTTHCDHTDTGRHQENERPAQLPEQVRPLSIHFASELSRSRLKLLDLRRINPFYDLSTSYYNSNPFATVLAITHCQLQQVSFWRFYNTRSELHVWKLTGTSIRPNIFTTWWEFILQILYTLAKFSKAELTYYTLTFYLKYFRLLRNKKTVE